MNNTAKFPPPKNGIEMVNPGDAGITEAKAQAINEDKVSLVSGDLVEEVFEIYKEVQDGIDELNAQRDELKAKKKKATSRLVEKGIPHRSISLAWELMQSLEKDKAKYSRVQIGLKHLSKTLGLDKQVDMFDA